MTAPARERPPTAPPRRTIAAEGHAPATTSATGLRRGAVNLLTGPGGSGKTWAAVEHAAIVLRRGGRVVFLDFDANNGDALTDRLITLGVGDGLAERWWYVGPEHAAGAVSAIVAASGWADLVVVDGWPEAVSLFGAHARRTDEVAAVASAVFGPLVAAGVVVLATAWTLGRGCSPPIDGFAVIPAVWESRGNPVRAGTRRGRR